MKVSIAGLNNEHLSNTKTLKNRNSGIKSVSMKNTPFLSPKMHNDQSPNINDNIYQKCQTNALKYQQISQKPSQQQSQLIIALLEKCLRPQIPNIKQNSYETDQLDSRVVFMINKTQTQNFINQPRPKSCGIKIGSKAQKHRQNNKSEPKKVYDLSNLSSKYQNSLTSNNKQLILGQNQYKKKTERKINTKILMTKKNSPQITEFTGRLKKFQQDLKKTKKPRILTLDLNQANCQHNEYKNYMSQKNHQMIPKSQSVSCQNIYVSPQFNSKKNQIEMDDIETVNKQYFPRYKFPNRESLQNLQKTKKINNFAMSNNYAVDSKIEDNRQIKSSEEIGIEMFNLDNLLPKEQIQFVLNRFKKEQPKYLEIISESRIDPTLQLLNISIPQVSYQNSRLKGSPSNKDKAEQSQLRQMQSQSFNFMQQQMLRATDYGKKVQPLHNIESPVSERRRSVYKIKPRQTFQQSKLRNLNDGAKTIVTKYDSSDKRSIVQESVILFQCSKDLKLSFSRQLLNLNDYAARYRGSLGVQSLINQNQEQYLLGNSKMEGRFFNESQNTFEKILMSPNPNNGKLKKSYSIKQMDSNNF